MFNQTLVAQDKGCGVVLIENAFELDQNFLFEYIAWLNKDKEETFTYIEENGKKFAINKTGFKFDLNDISQAPERFIDPLCEMTDRKPTPQQQQLIHDLEDLTYRGLVEYCKMYPEAAVSCWWRSPGHIATYSDGQRIGAHCDDNIPHEWGQASINEYPKHIKTSMNIYLNNGVETEDELDGTNFLGGDIIFKHAKYRFKPKTGSLVIYPTNYIGTHEVEPVTHGKRIAYLSAFLYGTPKNYGTPEDGSSVPTIVGEPEGGKIWMPNLKKDAGLN